MAVDSTITPLDSLVVNGFVHRFEDVGTVDLTQINLTAGTTYAFLVEGAEHNAGTMADPLVGIFSGDLSQLLTVQDDSGTSLDPTLDFTPLTSGRYVVGVIDYGGLGGTYGIGVFTIDPKPVTHHTLPFGDVRSG
jgi:hypothetical protein